MVSDFHTGLYVVLTRLSVVLNINDPQCVCWSTGQSFSQVWRFRDYIQWNMDTLPLYFIVSGNNVINPSRKHAKICFVSSLLLEALFPSNGTYKAEAKYNTTCAEPSSALTSARQPGLMGSLHALSKLVHISWQECLQTF